MKQKIKILLFIMAAGFFSQCEKYSSVKIIDENFLEALIEQGVDTDGDGTISFKEAANAKTLNIYYYDIFDLTGIESFVNLETLRCGENEFTELDVSQNTALKYLDISHNKLSSLDVSHNINLETLITMYNPLTSLDLSKNTALKHLGSESNPIKSRMFQTIYCWKN
jgi:Leucine-rich repeat (LRR) protein